jgi:hypothetical protein
VFDSVLGSLAAVIAKAASHIPGVPGLPVADITAAFLHWSTVIVRWFKAFPFLWHSALIFGLMMAVLIAKSAWYWINWLVNKIRGSG